MYVDGFVLAVPEANIGRYHELCSLAGRVWLKHGALEYVETVADDVPHGDVTDFYRATQARPGETIVFAYAVYRSREHRDEVVKAVMADPDMAHDPDSNPFDARRMIWGGFKPLLALKS
jgi:uncharacterized protein YbaA (DUF1428 family)